MLSLIKEFGQQLDLNILPVLQLVRSVLHSHLL